jgi:ribosomal RNA-processing protein 1
LGKFLASSECTLVTIATARSAADSRWSAGEKHVRDKAVQSLAKFLSAGQVKRRAQHAEGDDDEREDEELPVGDLDWDKEYEVDKRLSEPEMDKLWKGIFFCAFRVFLLESGSSC